MSVALLAGLQHAHSSAGSLWAWVVAAGGAIHGVRQSHEPRPRRNRTLVPQAHVHPEDGWQTASEDEGWTRQHSEAQPATPMAPLAETYVQPGMDYPPWQQMMPLVMVAMPQEQDPVAPMASMPGSMAPVSPPVPFAPGQLERVTTATSESSWASAASTVSRWTNRDCDWTNKKLMKPDSPQQRRDLLRQVIQDVWSLANSKNGTRVVQTALDVADYSEKQSLASIFQGRVWLSLKSPHANHVLQKIVALMPPEKIQFVIDVPWPKSDPL